MNIERNERKSKRLMKFRSGLECQKARKKVQRNQINLEESKRTNGYSNEGQREVHRKLKGGLRKY